MKQLSLFDDCKPKITWHLFVDGAARGNPGPAGAGVCLLKQQEYIIKQGVFLGIKTNNQAEYMALLLGLLYARAHVPRSNCLIISSDSELLVRQLTGAYSVKNKSLVCLYNHAKNLLVELDYRIVHVVRAENKVADQLANTGIDKRQAIPSEFLTDWHHYERCI